MAKRIITPEILQAAKAAWEAHEIGASELRAVVRRFKSQERKRRLRGRWVAP